MDTNNKPGDLPKTSGTNVDTSPEPEVPWWKQHPSSATALLVAGVTSALYFFGSKRLETFAQEFGLAAPPRSMGLQEVMVAGFDVLQLPILIIIFIAAIIIYLGFKLVLWAHRATITKQIRFIDEVDSQREKLTLIKARDKKDVHDSEIEELEEGLKLLSYKYRKLSKLKSAAVFANRLGKVLGLIVTSVAISLIMISGVMIGKFDAWIIRSDVSDNCSNCFLYEFSGNKIIARPLFQADDKIIAYRRQGTIIIPITQHLTIKRFVPATKKAGPLKKR